MPAENPHQLAIDYFTLAKDYLRAFREMPPHAPPDWPRYFMLCHAIELALKAYLALRGVSDAELKSRAFRHDFENCLTGAIARGLPLGPLAAAEIERLKTAHLEYWARYPRREAGQPVYTIEQFEVYAQELFDAAGRSIFGNAYQPRPSPRCPCRRGLSTLPGLLRGLASATKVG